MPIEVEDWDAPPETERMTTDTGFALRGRQPEWVRAIEADEARIRRILAVAPGGVGKSSVMSMLAHRRWKHGGRTLITENREHLTEQTAARVAKETGLEVGIEMADQTASPYAPVVVASVQTLGRPNRLTSFAEDHFSLVIPDECHFCLAPQPQRILRYFHWGAESLAEDWKAPERYVARSTVVGFTASPDIGATKNLGTFFQASKNGQPTVNYSYLEAIEEGWLVPPIEENIPVTIDTRKFRRTKNSEGAAFNTDDQSQAIAPIIKELAAQVVKKAWNRKTIAFLPSVETARMLAAALNEMGLTAIFVSGECLDKGEKTDLYNRSGPGTVLCNCALVAYGIDFVDTDCVAIFSAVISKCNYVQKIFRGTRVLPGLVCDDMTIEERRAAIAKSKKPYLLILSPFFISDRIDICGSYDLFGVPPDARKKVSKNGDFTDTKRIRDGIAAIEKAADKHRNKQPRTIDPVRFGLSIGSEAIANYVPETNADAARPSRQELDLLLAHGIDTTAVKNSGQAQKLIARIDERERLGLASPTQLDFLRKLTKAGPDGSRVAMFSEDWISTVKKNQAGAIIGRQRSKWGS
jgi:superfamily II DNA or RNA helicase